MGLLGVRDLHPFCPVDAPTSRVAATAPPSHLHSSSRPRRRGQTQLHPSGTLPGRHLPLASTQSLGLTCLQGRMGSVTRVLDG